MSTINTDFLLEVQKGNVVGHKIVHKFGRNDAIPNGVFNMVTRLSRARTLISTPTKVRIKAGGSAADVAGGSGARSITVHGINSNLQEVTEGIITAGAVASQQTTNSFWRVYRVVVSSSGTYGSANTGDMTIENAAGTTDVIKVAAGDGQSQDAFFSVPSNKTAYVLSAVITFDSVKLGDIRMVVLENFNEASGSVRAARVKNHWDGVSDIFRLSTKSPLPRLDPLTDVWFEASGSGATTQVSVDFEVLLIDR